MDPWKWWWEPFSAKECPLRRNARAFLRYGHSFATLIRFLGAFLRRNPRGRFSQPLCHCLHCVIIMSDWISEEVIIIIVSGRIALAIVMSY